MIKFGNGRMGGAPFSIGASVRLTARFAASRKKCDYGAKGDMMFRQNKYRRKPHGNSFPWAERVGVVERCTVYEAGIRWPGRKSLDWVPVGGLEIADDQGES